MNQKGSWRFWLMIQIIRANLCRSALIERRGGFRCREHLILRVGAWISTRYSMHGIIRESVASREERVSQRTTDFQLFQPLNPDVAELYRIIVAGEAEETGGPVFAWMFVVGHVIAHFAEVGVEDYR